MRAALKPMSLGEILDRTFQIYRARFWVFVGISAFPAAAMAVLQILNLLWWNLRPPQWIPILDVNFGLQVYFAGRYHCSLFLHAFAWPCMIVAASQAYLGECPGLRAAVAGCGRRWRSWIGLALLVQFVIVFLAELAGAGVFLGVTALADWLSHDNANGFMDEFLPPFLGAVILAGFAFSLWMGTLYLESIPAWCAEGLTLRRSFKRARLLSKGSRWRVLMARVFPAILFFALETMLAMAVRWAVILFAGMLHHSVFQFARLYYAANAISWATVSALLGPVFPIALTLIYYDQRIRKEGFDVEWMMQAAGMTSEPDAAEQSAPAPVAVESVTPIEDPVQPA
ncbi:MAG TPA: hypothetical protein VMD29_01175 [Terracidiphilus sp.]|nr:hypothetical protein [Terracidiphilus sp.]